VIAFGRRRLVAGRVLPCPRRKKRVCLRSIHLEDVAMRPLLALALLLATIGTATADPMHLSGLKLPLTISGVAVTLTADADIDAQPTNDGMAATGKINVNLADLQAHALDLARTIALPNDKCMVTVNRLDSAAITPKDDAAHLSIAGNITGHLCKGPLKADANSNLTIGADVVAALKDDEVGLALSGPIQLDASADLIKAVIKAFRKPLQASIGKAITHALDATDISTALPALKGVPLKVTAAKFYGAGPTLMLSADVSANLTAAQLTALAGQ
jgi:hypothetical protein